MSIEETLSIIKAHQLEPLIEVPEVTVDDRPLCAQSGNCKQTDSTHFLLLAHTHDRDKVCLFSNSFKLINLLFNL